MSGHILTQEEQLTLSKLDNYFKQVDMSLYDKIFNALVIAEHELSGHCFSNENERLKIESFRNTLNNLRHKISDGE